MQECVMMPHNDTHNFVKLIFDNLMKKMAELRSKHLQD